MSVYFECGSFAAPPRAGCRFACGLLGAAIDNGTGMHLPDPNITYTITRDPADWLRSYYQKDVSEVQVGELPRLHELKEQSFGKEREPTESCLYRFVNLYLNECPGVIRRIFECYQPSEVTWRIEDLPRAAEEHFGRHLRPYPRRWQTPNRLTIEYEQAVLIRDHERAYCDQWGY